MFIILQRALLELFFIFRKYMAYHSTLVHASFCYFAWNSNSMKPAATAEPITPATFRAHCVA